MPDFAPNYTFRYRVKYVGNGHTHHLLWRYAPSTTVAALPAIRLQVQDFLNAVGPANFYADFTILGADYALADSDIFLPAVPVPVFSGTFVLTGRPESAEAAALSFPGKSSLGQRAIFFLFGTIFQPATAAGVLDFRILASENANISDAVDVLDATDPVLVANDGVEVNWYPYANFKYNDYWVRQVRL